MRADRTIFLGACILLAGRPSLLGGLGVLVLAALVLSNRRS